MQQLFHATCGRLQLADLVVCSHPTLLCLFMAEARSDNSNASDAFTGKSQKVIEDFACRIMQVFLRLHMRRSCAPVRS